MQLGPAGPGSTKGDRQATGDLARTVRRCLRSEMPESAYAERQSASAIDRYAFQLLGWLQDRGGIIAQAAA